MSAVLREACFILREKASMHGDVCGPCSDCRLEPYLQALIQPKQAVPLAGVHPGVGLRWCGEEGHGEEFIYLNADWRMRFYDKADHFCGPWDLERRTDNGWDARVEPGPSIALLAFQAGRAYERWQS